MLCFFVNAVVFCFFIHTIRRSFDRTFYNVLNRFFSLSFFFRCFFLFCSCCCAGRADGGGRRSNRNDGPSPLVLPHHPHPFPGSHPSPLIGPRRPAFPPQSFWIGPAIHSLNRRQAASRVRIPSTPTHGGMWGLTLFVHTLRP